MKSPIEILTEVHEVGKVHPDLYEALKVEPKILVAAIVSLADRLEEFKKSKNESTAEGINPNELAKGNLQGKLHKVLSTAGERYEEKATVIYRTLTSLE